MVGKWRNASTLGWSCCNVLPVNRASAMGFIQQEMRAARAKRLEARLLVPLTRGDGEVTLQLEVKLTSLDQLDRFRQSDI